MSYCVNCCVELEKTLQKCPLCNTPVLNPNEFKQPFATAPFPKHKGDVEEADRKDAAIFITIVLIATGIGCGVLNWLVFSKTLWSIPVIGVCFVFWVIMIPFCIYRKASIYLSILLDGVAVVLYLYMITWLTQENNWFYGLGIPIVVLLTVISEIVALLFRLLPKSFLWRGLCGITALGVICTGMELLIDHYLHGTWLATWSAVVATVCVIVDIMIITLLCRRRLRNEIRRRLHF